MDKLWVCDKCSKEFNLSDVSSLFHAIVCEGPKIDALLGTSHLTDPEKLDRLMVLTEADRHNALIDRRN